MRKGFTIVSANNDVDLVVKAKAPAADTLMNERRLIEEFIGGPEGYVVSSEVETSLNISETARDSSTSVGMTKTGLGRSM